jgi:hypothetical protein
VPSMRLYSRSPTGGALLSNYFAAVLRPEPVDRFLAEGGAGVPLFGADELDAFVSDADEAPPDRPRHGRWWEFWPTSDGSYAMFPGDDARQPSVALTLWIPVRKLARVHRIDVSSLLPIINPRLRDRPRSRDRPVVPRELCELCAEEVEPGAPWVGRCSDLGCDRGCDRLILVYPMTASIASWDATANGVRRRADHDDRRHE